MGLAKHVDLRWHHTTRRIREQTRDYFIADSSWHIERIRSGFREIGEESEVAVGVFITVGEHVIEAIHLQALDVVVRRRHLGQESEIQKWLTDQTRQGVHGCIISDGINEA